MKPRERVMAAVHGQATDRTPFSVWYHFRLDPPAGPGSKMAAQEIAFYRRYQPDFLKVMHDIAYEPTLPLEKPSDWAMLKVLDPRVGNFAAQLFTLCEIRDGIGPDIPMIETVFGVYHYAHELSEGRLLGHLRENPQLVHVGLRVIAESLARYAKACISAGCDGIYYALSGASEEGARPEEYAQHFLPYDRHVLEAVESYEFNVLHLHGYSGLYFELTHDLPASAICWSDRAGGPSLLEARRFHGGCIVGGLDETKIDQMSIGEIEQQGESAAQEAGGHSFILAPGCAIPSDCAAKRIDAIRTVAEETRTVLSL